MGWFLVFIFSLLVKGLSSFPSWKYNPLSTTTTILGLDVENSPFFSSNLAAATSLMNIGGSIERYTTNDGWKFDSDILGSLLFDVVLSNNLTVTVGFTSLYRSVDAGKSYHLVNSIMGTSQSISIINNNDDGNTVGIAAVGSFVTKSQSDPLEGIALSSDSGETWRIISIPAGNCRYGSFPSKVSFSHSDTHLFILRTHGMSQVVTGIHFVNHTNLLMVSPSQSRLEKCLSYIPHLLLHLSLRPLGERFPKRQMEVKHGPPSLLQILPHPIILMLLIAPRRPIVLL